MLPIRHGEAVRRLSRRGNDLLPCFPEIADCLRQLPDLVLDGELVVLDEQPQFERLSRQARMKRSMNVEAAALADPAVMFAFDILALRGKDLRKLPLLKRKDIVQQALQGSQRRRFSPVKAHRAWLAEVLYATVLPGQLFQ